MSNPTHFNNWSLPRTEENPWYEKFARLWQSIDNSMAFIALFTNVYNPQMTAVETSTPPNHSLVWSHAPSGTTFMATSVGELQRWYTVSFAPSGPVVGSFSIVASGNQAWVLLDHGYFISHAVTGVDCGYLEVYPRVVITGGPPTSIPKTCTVGDSAWGMSTPYAQLNTRYHWEAIVSLAPGLYSATFEMRGTANGSSSLRTMAMNGNDSVSLNIIEGRMPAL